MPSSSNLAWLGALGAALALGAAAGCRYDADDPPRAALHEIDLDGLGPDTALLAAMLEAEDRRGAGPRGLDPLLEGLGSPHPVLQRMAVRGLGRLERDSLAPIVAPLLATPIPAVRAEAANALGQAVANGDAGVASGPIRERLDVETDPWVTGVMAATLGRLPYRDSGEVRRTARILVRLAESALRDAGAVGVEDVPAGPEGAVPTGGAGGAEPSTSPERSDPTGAELEGGVPEDLSVLLGVARGLESLVRRSGGVDGDPKAGAMDNAETSDVGRVLSGLARMGRQDGAPPQDRRARAEALIRRYAMAGLVGVELGGAETIRDALADPDLEVRRLGAVAARTWDALPRRPELIAVALSDDAPVVRYEGLRALRERESADRVCEAAIAAVGDSDPHVSLLALETMGDSCAGRSAEAIVILEGYAEVAQEEDLPGLDDLITARAVLSLARLSPATAEAMIGPLVTHGWWVVRAWAARAAGILDAVPLLETLTADEHPNVRTAAITELSRAVGHDADAAYVDALSSADYQLLITASGALEGTPSRDVAVPAILEALERVTAERRETSRDARLALLGCLQSVGGRGEAEALIPYLGDYDPAVAAAAASVLEAWIGRPTEATPRPLPPPPLPGLRELDALARTRVTLVMAAGGSFEIRLLPWLAPTNAARFARMAREGWFDGLTFHRVVPGFVIQGGSPGANEYWGDGPYTRDELGWRSHRRGTVGLSTRGRDTGDGQIFVNLVDNVRLDYEYTIFGEVVEGMEVVDGILEGAVIERVVIEERPAG